MPKGREAFDSTRERPISGSVFNLRSRARRVILAAAFLLLPALVAPGLLRAAPGGKDSNGDIAFRKVKLFFLESDRRSPVNSGLDRAVEFERKRALYGAITPSDQRERYGNYFTLFWDARRRADVTVRLEYVQQHLGPEIQRKDQRVTGAFGRQVNRFQVLGDDYLQYGRVLAWRALLFENGRVVSERRSYLWR